MHGRYTTKANRLSFIHVQLDPKSKIAMESAFEALIKLFISNGHLQFFSFHIVQKIRKGETLHAFFSSFSNKGAMPT